jgi:hypothetical protein
VRPAGNRVILATLDLQIDDGLTVRRHRSDIGRPAPKIVPFHTLSANERQPEGAFHLAQRYRRYAAPRVLMNKEDVGHINVSLFQSAHGNMVGVRDAPREAARLAGRMLDRAGTESWQVGRGSGWRSRRYGLRAGRAELSRDK